MLEELITAKLDSMNVKWTKRGHEIQCQCLNPKHLDSHPSFSINSDNGAYNCFSCGFKGNFKSYLGDAVDPDMERNMKYLRAIKELEEAHSPVDDDPHLNVSQMLPPDSGLTLPEDGIRGISKKLLDDLGVYWCDKGRYKGRLIFIVKDVDGMPLGFDARIWQHPDGPQVAPNIPDAKYLRPTYMKTKDVVYGVDYIVNHFSAVDYVIITEGVFDAISWLQLGIPAVANFGLAEATPNKAGMLLSIGVSDLANGFDFDVKGMQGWQRIKDSWKQYLHIIPPTEEIMKWKRSGISDINDYLQCIKVGCD